MREKTTTKPQQPQQEYGVYFVPNTFDRDEHYQVYTALANAHLAHNFPFNVLVAPHEEIQSTEQNPVMSVLYIHPADQSLPDNLSDVLSFKKGGYALNTGANPELFTLFRENGRSIAFAHNNHLFLPLLRESAHMIRPIMQCFKTQHLRKMLSKKWEAQLFKLFKKHYSENLSISMKYWAGDLEAEHNNLVGRIRYRANDFLNYAAFVKAYEFFQQNQNNSITDLVDKFQQEFKDYAESLRHFIKQILQAGIGDSSVNAQKIFFDGARTSDFDYLKARSSNAASKLKYLQAEMHRDQCKKEMLELKEKLRLVKARLESAKKDLENEGSDHSLKHAFNLYQGFHNQGSYLSITCRYNNIIAVTGPVYTLDKNKQKDFHTGLYTVKIDANQGELRFSSEKAHPHIDMDGGFCLGNVTDDVYKFINSKNCLLALQLIHKFRPKATIPMMAVIGIIKY